MSSTGPTKRISRTRGGENVMLAKWWRDRFGPRTLGQQGERAAERHLRRLGYKIVARGERDRIGELDLVAVQDRTIVFVEVKTRRSVDKGSPAEAVDEQKQAKLTHLALAYLKRHGLLEYSSRFDVVSVLWPADARTPQIEHFENAFEAQGSGQMYS